MDLMQTGEWKKEKAFKSDKLPMRLSVSQWLAVPGVAGAGIAGGGATAVGSVFLPGMPQSLVCRFTDQLIGDICGRLATGHGRLALGGTASPQGGHIVIDYADELAHWCKPFKSLRKACHAHVRQFVLAGQGHRILDISSWAKLDLGAAPCRFANHAYQNCGVAYGAVGPHQDTGDASNVRVCFSFCATKSVFSPPAWHAAATKDDCIDGVAGHIHNGSVTLQVGGVGFHAMGPLAPDDVRLAVLCNVKLSTALDWSLLDVDAGGVRWEALRLTARTHGALVELTTQLPLCIVSERAQKRVVGAAGGN